MMSNEKKNTADFPPWDRVEGLGWSVSQQHKRIARQMGGYFERNHLGQNRVSLATDIYRRHHHNSSALMNSGDFPFVNFFSRAALETPDEGKGILSQTTLLQRAAIETPIEANAAINFEPSNAMVQRYSNITSAQQKPSARITPSDPLSSETAQNPVSQPADFSGQPRILRKTGSIDGQPHLVTNPLSNTANNQITSQVSETQGTGQLNSAIPAQVSTVKENSSLVMMEGYNTLPNIIAMKTGIAVGISRKMIPTVNEYLAKPELNLRDNIFGFPVGNYQIGRHSMGIARRVVDDGNFPKKIMPVATTESPVAKAISLDYSYTETTNDSGAKTGLSPVLMGSAPEFARETRVSRSKISTDSSRTEALPGHSSIQRTVSRYGGGKNEFPANSLLTSSFHYLSPLTAKSQNLNQPSEIASAKPVATATLSDHYLPVNKSGMLTAVDAGTSMVYPTLISRMEPDYPGLEHGSSDITHFQDPMQRAINRKYNTLFQFNFGQFEYPVYGGQQAPNFTGHKQQRGNTLSLISPFNAINRKFSPSALTNIGINPENPTVNFKPLDQSHYGHQNPLLAGEDTGETTSNLMTMGLSQPHQKLPNHSPGERFSNSSVQQAISRFNDTLPIKNNEIRSPNVLVSEQIKLHRNLLSAEQDSKFAPQVQRKISLPSSKSGGIAPESPIVRSAPPKHDFTMNNTNVLAGDSDSGLLASDYISSSISQMIVHPEQILRNNSHQEKRDSHSSVQRAVDRQNGSLSQITPEPKIWNQMPELPTTATGNIESVYKPLYADNSGELGPKRISAKQEGAYQLNTSPLAYSQGHQNGYPAISSNNRNGESGNSVHSNNISSLLMRSTIMSPTRTTYRIQPSLGQQQSLLQSPIRRAIARNSDHTLVGKSTRPVETTNLNVLTLSPRANLFSGGEESFISRTTWTSPIEQGDSFYSNRAVDLPLSQPYMVQRKAALSGDHAVTGDSSGYLQRQEINHMGTSFPQATLVQAGETAGSTSGKSDSNALSTDDIVDKVWRKLMRKLVSEQERMGGSNRWA